jgi:hypothetical protein
MYLYLLNINPKEKPSFSLAPLYLVRRILLLLWKIRREISTNAEIAIRNSQAALLTRHTMIPTELKAEI